MQNIIKLANACGFAGSPENKIAQVRALFTKNKIPTNGKEIDSGLVVDGKVKKKRVIEIDGVQIDCAHSTAVAAGEELGYSLQKVIAWVLLPEPDATPAKEPQSEVLSGEGCAE